NDALKDAIILFNQRRDEITTALISPELKKRKLERSHKYVDDFYEIINDPEKLQEQILNKCRGPRSASVRKTNTSSAE
ncbi:MAG: hypothetical protein DRR11_15450, partial [Gammaproteobacteria bacterium]